jgi:hypothetical protein
MVRGRGAGEYLHHRRRTLANDGVEDCQVAWRDVSSAPLCCALLAGVW